MTFVPLYIVFCFLSTCSRFYSRRSIVYNMFEREREREREREMEIVQDFDGIE